LRRQAHGVYLKAVLLAAGLTALCLIIAR